MRWEDFRQSENIEDRRDGGDPGGGMSLPIPGGGEGLGIGAVILLTLIGWVIGVDPRILIGGAEMVTGGRAPQQQVQPQSPSRPQAPPTDEVGRFVAAIVGNNEDIWAEILPAQKGIRFQPAPLVMFAGQTSSSCGRAQSAMGPFYCPVDRKMYLDTSFFREMQRKFGGGGDAAYAYVIAHEMGHHIENLLGILPKVQRAQQQASSQAEANGLSVRVELMADCLAGVWMAHSQRKGGGNVFNEEDLKKAINTANAIGDDTLQKAGRGYAVPDSFTHGSSEQRQRWLQQGMRSGQIDSCNTFSR